MGVAPVGSRLCDTPGCKTLTDTQCPICTRDMCGGHTMTLDGSIGISVGPGAHPKILQGFHLAVCAHCGAWLGSPVNAYAKAFSAIFQPLASQLLQNLALELRAHFAREALNQGPR